MKNLAFLLIATMSIALVGCDNDFISQQTTANSIVIDGNDNDWGEENITLAQNVSLGIKNDNQYLYLYFTAPIKTISSEILEQEIAFQFQTKNGKKVGLKFKDEQPKLAGKNENDKRAKPKGQQRKAEDSTKSGEERIPDNKTNFEIIERKIEIFAKTIEVTNFRGNSKTYELERTFGTEAKIGVNKQNFVFEMKIPYNNDVSFPFRLNNAGKDEIFVSMEITPKERERKFDQNQQFSQDGNSSKQENRPPRGGSKGGGMGKSDKERKQSALSHKFSIVLNQN